MKTDLYNVVVVIYDGIENSVFESQVIAPLLIELDEKLYLTVTLVSFERSVLPDDLVAKKIPVHERLQFFQAKKIPFFGVLSLLPALWQLVKIVRTKSINEFRSRGPLAGWVVLRVAEKLIKNYYWKVAPLILVQARGLAAEEYRYAVTRTKRNFFQKMRDFITKKMLHKIEQAVYGYRGFFILQQRFVIESVSLALRKYLIQTFAALPANITIASRDIPKKELAANVQVWRSVRRLELGIPFDAEVYVYSGSYKPWQCADETVAYAANELAKNPQAFFLVLTGDVKLFEAALRQAQIDLERCKIIRVPSFLLTEYLAAADIGFLLREADVINWVSRPTKMLEYQAVNLKVLHNDTVACLVEHSD